MKKIKILKQQQTVADAVDTDEAIKKLKAMSVAIDSIKDEALSIVKAIKADSGNDWQDVVNSVAKPVMSARALLKALNEIKG